MPETNETSLQKTGGEENLQNSSASPSLKDEKKPSEDGNPSVDNPYEASNAQDIVDDERQSKVAFDKIEIREYPRCLGDHPSVSMGPPISLGWKYDRRYLLELSEYEKYRGDSTDREVDGKDQQQQQPRRRRCPAEFQLPSSLRHQILREECAHDDQEAQKANTSCTEAEINACIREVHKTKNQRRSSYAMHEFEHIQIVVESAFRKFRRLITKASGPNGKSIESGTAMVSATPSASGNSSSPVVVSSMKGKRDKDLRKVSHHSIDSEMAKK